MSAQPAKWTDMDEATRIDHALTFVTETFAASGGAMPAFRDRRAAAVKIARSMDRVWRGHVDGCETCKKRERTKGRR
jgi:hypothetical protein